MVVDGGIGVGSKIIQKLVHTGGSFGIGDKLIGSNVIETNEDGIVDGYAIL